MAREFFKDLPNTTTPLTASRLNGLLNGYEALGSIVVDDVNCKNMLNPYTFINGNIDSSGNYSSNQVNYLSAYIEVQPNTQYIASANVNQAYFQISEFNSSKTFIKRTALTTTSTNTITTTANTKYVRVSYNKDNSTTMTQAILLGFEPQFELGEERTTYTLYKKIIKEQNGYVKESCTFYANDFVSKNMFNENYYASGILISDAGAETSTSAWNTSYYIEVNSSTTYTISYTGTVSAPIRVSYYNSSKTFISRITPDANPYSFTTPSNAKYVRISFASSGLSNIQLEAGNEQTPYTPYKNFDGEIYSTGEIVIGNWIDGKPIYRQVFETTNITSSNTDFIKVSNVETPIRLHGVLFSTSGNRFIMPSYDTSTNYNVIWWRSSSGYIRGRAVLGDGGSLQKCIIVFEYTKTTD